MSEVPALRMLWRVNQKQGCGRLTDSVLADGVVFMLERASAQPEKSRSKWLTRFLAAEMLLHAGRMPEAQKQAEEAWKASGDLPVGAMLSQIYASRNLRPEAERLLAVLERKMKPYDTLGQAELAKTRALLKKK
jgi:predicted Zn-dependent protease